MIKTYDYTPEYYSKNSRDFQLLTHLYDSIFNLIKTEIDMMFYNPFSKNVDRTLLELTAKTLGFESLHEYSVDSLYALCSSFKSILKIKGTKKSIEDSIKLLLKSQNMTFPAQVEVDSKNCKVDIYIPTQLKDTILLEDLLDYILPAGFVYTLYFRDIIVANPKESVVKFNLDAPDIKRFDTTKIPAESTSYIVSDITNTQILTPKVQ